MLVAIQRVVGGIDAALDHARERHGPVSEEQHSERADGIRDVHDAIVIGISGVLTSRSSTTKEKITQRKERIGNVDSAVGV